MHLRLPTRDARSNGAPPAEFETRFDDKSPLLVVIMELRFMLTSIPTSMVEFLLEPLLLQMML